MYWDNIYTTEQLLAIRTRALKRREKDLEEVRLYLRRMRENRKEQFDRRNRIRKDILKYSILILVYSTFRVINILRLYKLFY